MMSEDLENISPIVELSRLYRYMPVKMNIVSFEGICDVGNIDFIIQLVIL